jgi:alpha-glucosidase
VPVPTQEHVFGYERRHVGERLLVLLNLGHEPETVTLPDDATEGEVLLSTHLNRDGEGVGSTIDLRRDEGLIIRLGGRGPRSELLGLP